MTIRIQIPEARTGRSSRTSRRPIIFILWHNRLFLAAEISRGTDGGHPIYGLISASRDGAWLAAFFSGRGPRAVRGSSSRNGREAATALVDVLRSGLRRRDHARRPAGPGLRDEARRTHRGARARFAACALSAWTSSPRGGLPAGTGSTSRARSRGCTCRFELVHVEELERPRRGRAPAGRAPRRDQSRPEAGPGQKEGVTVTVSPGAAR
jgi:hypothetical protein